MDPIKAEKLRAMKSYKKGQSFGYNFLFHSLIALTCSLLCSFPFWFASISSSMNCFLFMSLPSVWSSFSNPKCLFVVVNVIVIFLVGESKFLGSSNSSKATDIYSEYVERSQSLKERRQYSSSTTLQEKKEDKNLKDECYSAVVKRVEDVKEVEAKEDEVDEFEDCKEDDGEENNITDDHHQQERDGEEEVGLPVEELNKRVEDFIARVNKQRWLEELEYSNTKA